MFIILDISKAYDRVVWNYLKNVIIVIGFKPNLIALIMKCVSSTSFSVFGNGTLKGHIVLSRGLR